MAPSGRHFSFIFLVGKVSRVEAQCHFRYVPSRKVVFLRVLPNLLPFPACFEETNELLQRSGYDSPRGLCTEQIGYFPNAGPPPLCFVCLFSFPALPHFATANYKRLFKFVASQVVASVVIRAAKLQFITESRSRVYFAKHVVSA